MTDQPDTPKPEPLSDAEIAAETKLHRPNPGKGLGEFCYVCEYTWPCWAARVGATIDAYKQERDAAREEVRRLETACASLRRELGLVD